MGRTADPYSRLRVPQFQKSFEALFFVIFLILYYAVLVERNPQHVTVTEVFLYIWLAGFAYDEFGEFTDAGILFYQTDFWSLWDIGIILTGAAFLITSQSFSSRHAKTRLYRRGYRTRRGHRDEVLADGSIQGLWVWQKAATTSSTYLSTSSRWRHCFSYPGQST